MPELEYLWVYFPVIWQLKTSDSQARMMLAAVDCFYISKLTARQRYCLYNNIWKCTHNKNSVVCCSWIYFTYTPDTPDWLNIVSVVVKAAQPASSIPQQTVGNSARLSCGSEGRHLTHVTTAAGLHWLSVLVL